MAAVLKTAEVQASVGSNPTPSATPAGVCGDAGWDWEQREK